MSEQTARAVSEQAARRVSEAGATKGRSPSEPSNALSTLLSVPGTRMVVLATSKDVNAKVSVLVARPGDDAMSLVIKVPSTAVAEAAVVAEGRVLVDLQRRGPAAVAGTVPRFLGEYEIGGLAAVAATVVPGTPMRTAYHQWRHTGRPATVRRDFAAAAAWLAAFQSGSAAAPAPSRLLADALTGVDRRWPADPRVVEVAGLLAPAQALMDHVSTPRTAVHGDYWHGNLLVRGGAVSGVVDWECGSLLGEPLRDVARFPLAYATYLDRHTRTGRTVPGHRGLVAGVPGAAVEHALFGTEWFGDLVRQFVAAALARLGAPPGLWRLVLLAGIAEVAATADHPVFAEQHLDLLLRLARRAEQERTADDGMVAP